MKSLLIVLVFAFFSCSLYPAKNIIRSQSSVSEEIATSADFSDPENRIASLNQIEGVFQNPAQTFASPDVDQKLKAVATDIAYKTLMFTYSDQLASALKLKDIFDWHELNPNASRALHNYIDPQEPDENGEPIWQTTNRNLRNSNPLTPTQISFKTEMIAALNTLPATRAIVYRGVSLRTIDFEKYKTSKEVIEKSFVSTSLDPQIAMGFTSGKGDVSTVFVIDSHSGRPISFVVPTNMHEMEILFKPNTGFDVVKVVQSVDLKSATIFLKEKRLNP